jgi:hypothetical protein
MKLAIFRWLLALALAAASLGAAAQVPLPNFDQLEQKLKIRPEQKEQFDIATGATRRALLAVGLAMLQVKDRVAAELAKPNPDLSVLARSYDDVIDQSRPLFREAGVEWRKLYAQLDPEQVEIARQFLRDSLGKVVPGTTF